MDRQSSSDAQHARAGVGPRRLLLKWLLLLPSDFAVGAVKMYGKPILDRVIKNDTPLEDVARCALVSMDSTIKSNSTVAPPIETLIFDFASFDHDHYVKMDVKDPYLENLRIIWDQKIKEAFSSLPKFEWENLG